MTVGPDTVTTNRAVPQHEAGTDPPLAGITIIDLSRVLAGPFATMLLGDLGAEVIKVERPGGGDDTRQWGPPFVGPEGAKESTYYLSANRNKRSIVLDLRDPADLGVLKTLLRSADVVVENFRPGVMDRLGLSKEVLTELNPALVVLSISGFGSKGPDRTRVGYDQILQAEGGLMSLTGLEIPTRVGVPVADLTAGLIGVIGILAALIERNNSGRGQQVQTSLLASMVALHTFQGTRYLIGGEVPGKSGNHHPTVAPYGLFWAADGPLVIAVGNQDIWRRFAPLLGLTVDDPDYADNAARLAHARPLEERVNERLGAQTVQHWIEVFAAAGVPAGEVRSLDRVYSDPHLIAEGLVTEVDHPTLGRIRLPGNPLQFSRSRAPEILPPPLLGEHSAEIRAAQ
ncbi:MAG TPA: CoA transferase [Mycobacteriales bacterium]|jgi:formyl-CoA transferase|nr:CoA transferase [Mycobacteriales bacterium]